MTNTEKHVKVLQDGNTEQWDETINEMQGIFAHRLALELEYILTDKNTNWDRAMSLLGEYRSAMNAIHEQHSPTFMGEPPWRTVTENSSEFPLSAKRVAALMNRAFMAGAEAKVAQINSILGLGVA